MTCEGLRWYVESARCVCGGEGGVVLFNVELALAST